MEIRKFLCGAEEEFILAKRWQEHQDPKAAEKLVGPLASCCKNR
jgi:RNA polymerase sigma-32 factor